MGEKSTKKKEVKKREKPISLSGASFDEVVEALLKTQKPERDNKKNG